MMAMTYCTCGKLGTTGHPKYCHMCKTYTHKSYTEDYARSRAGHANSGYGATSFPTQDVIIQADQKAAGEDRAAEVFYDTEAYPGVS